MRLLGLDIETTGLDHAKDFVTELAWVIKDHRDPKPLQMQTHFIEPVEDLFALSPEITVLTKIEMKHLAYGKPLEDVMRWLADDCETFQVEGIVAHNGENFDKPFLQAQSKGFAPSGLKNIFERQWIDSSVDCVFPADCRGTNLLYVAAYYGFLNPFPHAALFDAMTCLKVVDHFDIAPLYERAKTPWVYVQAIVTFAEKDKAKERRYYWEKVGDKTFPKTWVKKIKETELEKERADAPFQVLRLEM